MNIYRCFPEGKFKVLTMSYDDGKIEDRRLVSIFNKYGIKGTFNINSGILDDSERIKSEEFAELYNGHEVASHTYTHPTIARSPLTEVVKQIMQDRTQLESALGYPVRGLAYPNGSYNEEIIRMLPNLGIEYARVVGSTDGFAMPEDYMRWKATCHHNHNLLENAQKFVDLFKSQYLYMMYVWGHSYEFTMSNNWDIMEEFCERVGNRDDIWYATNIEIVDYMKVCDSLKFTAAGDYVYNPSAAAAYLSVGGEIVRVAGGEGIKLKTK